MGRALERKEMASTELVRRQEARLLLEAKSTVIVMLGVGLV